MNEERQQPATPKPRSVTVAIRAMWTLFIVGVIYIVVTYTQALASGDAAPGGLLPVGIMQAIILLALAFLIHMVNRGRNWARVVYVIIACIALVAMLIVVFGNLAGPAIDWLSVAISLGLVVAYGFILFQLFRPESKEWFRAIRLRGEA